MFVSAQTLATLASFAAVFLTLAGGFGWIVRRSDTAKGFVVVARRWVVERTLGWLSQARRLNRDHERRPDHHVQMVWWAGLVTLTRRMARQRLHWPEYRPHRLDPRPA